MISSLLKSPFRYILFDLLKYIPWTQEMCNEVVHIEPQSLEFIPDHFKTQDMCSKAVEAAPYTLWYVPVHFRMQEMYKRAIEADLYLLGHVPNHLKT